MNNNSKGYILIGLMLEVAILSFFVLFTVQALSSTVNEGKKLKKIYTKQNMAKIRIFIVNALMDVDNDGYDEPLATRETNKLPLSIPDKLTDEWGTEYRYCAWDLGELNSVNQEYSQNNVAPPVKNMLFRIISAGENKIFESDCSSASINGDDIGVTYYAVKREN